MSKRHGATAIVDYQKAGYTKEAIINYLALLGWNPGTEQEVFSLAELIATFDITQVHKSGAVFDIKKFDWFNRQYLEKLSVDEFTQYVQYEIPARLISLPQYSPERFDRAIPTIRERINVLTDFHHAIEAGEYDFMFEAPTYDTDMLQWKNDSSVADALPRLQQALVLLEVADFTSPEAIKAALWDYAEVVGRGELLWPLRVTLSGQKQSPDPFTIAFILGKEETSLRIITACGKISG
jgi:glutamyl/glutaminyl-tRNA synthetase